MFPSSLNMALKEWDVVRHALHGGRQIILLRKGGIADRSGEFKLEHDQFLIFPTFVHQNYKMLKPEVHAWFLPAAREPDQLGIDTVVQVTDVLQLRDRARMDRVEDQHIWSPPLIDMRFNYKPEKPLYLLIVRAYAVREAVTIENTPQYAGCKSWVPLAVAIDCHGVRAVVDEQTFQSRRNQILALVR